MGCIPNALHQMLASLWCAITPNLLIMSGCKRWHSWQPPADEMSGNIAWLYYRLLYQLMRVPTTHIPGEWYYTSLFQLNNINLLLQSPLCHCSLNEDLGFVLPSLYCWYQLVWCLEEGLFFWFLFFPLTEEDLPISPLVR